MPVAPGRHSGSPRRGTLPASWSIGATPTRFSSPHKGICLVRTKSGRRAPGPRSRHSRRTLLRLRRPLRRLGRAERRRALPGAHGCPRAAGPAPAHRRAVGDGPQRRNGESDARRFFGTGAGAGRRKTRVSVARVLAERRAAHRKHAGLKESNRKRKENSCNKRKRLLGVARQAWEEAAKVRTERRLSTFIRDQAILFISAGNMKACRFSDGRLFS